MSHTFKVGDRVRFKNLPVGWWFKDGQEGVISADRGDDYTLMWIHRFEVDVIDGIRSHLAFVDAEHIELVKPAETPGTFIIVVMEGADFKPAATPRVYKPAEQARAVATKMAERHGGRFVVFQATEEAFLPKAPVSVIPFVS